MAILFTGFPGSLGSQLLPRVLRGGRSVLCIVQSRFVDRAGAQVKQIEQADPSLKGRIRLVEGDISAPALGLSEATSTASTITEIYHLAASYELSVERDTAMRVNVEGTRNVLDFAARCSRLERLHHISTCYVSGRFAGIFTEDDLDRGQTFNNVYEESKFLAEMHVRSRMKDGMPATIYRPSIIVGDSETGATQKFDGPYYAIRWILRQRGKIAVMPVIGDPNFTQLNVVPRDFVVSAIATLAAMPESKGKTYQLADPDPPTINEMLHEIGRAAGKHIFRVQLPRILAKSAIDFVPGLYRMMGIPSAAVDYFVHPTYYTTSNTKADLRPSGLAVPRFSSYVDALVSWAREHINTPSEAMY